MSQAARQRHPAGPPADASGEHRLITLDEIQQESAISTFITSADRVMEGLGYTEHGFRHANLTSRIAFNVLSRLGHEGRMAELATIAAYLHDVGNMVARENHGPTGALLVYDVLKDRMLPADLALVMSAIGNHEEEGGEAVSPVSLKLVPVGVAICAKVVQPAPLQRSTT